MYELCIFAEDKFIQRIQQSKLNIMKIRFNSDYIEGAHPAILQKLIETNTLQQPGYGTDDYCEQARTLIRQLCAMPTADVHFLVGGTQTNTTVIASLLRPHQGVLCAETGHINVHETGAIEANGHKVLSLPSDDGKISAQQIEQAYASHWNDENHEHMVQPGMVYISFPTENGTIYSRNELEAIYTTCQKCKLPLFIDGARLGYGLAATRNDVSLEFLAHHCDVFYIGGTKVGALFGEAVVIPSEKLKKDFRYLIKQKGGMLAKGWLLGMQFLTLLENGLYFDIAEHADKMAQMIHDAFAAKGNLFLYDSPTNQQFPILKNTDLEKLSEHFVSDFWCKTDSTHTAVRFCTSWSTKLEDVESLIKAIRNL